MENRLKMKEFELAREYGRKYRDRYPGGTYSIPWGGGNELVALSEIGSVVLGIDFPPDEKLEDRAGRTIRALTAEPHLLIFDNRPWPDDSDGCPRWRRHLKPAV